LVGGEVVINVRGTLGGVARVPDELAGYNVAREVAVVPVGATVDPDFLVSVFASGYFWNLIQESLRGIAYVGLNLRILRQMPIPVPPLAEQRRIVKALDELLAKCDNLERLFLQV
jgi:type I restriction enzyme S subunit